MKVYLGGARFYAGQVQRIAEGFVQLKHELTDYPHVADLIYVNNPPFREIIADKTAGKLHGKVIFDVQDIPHHIPTYDTKGLAAQLSHADAVTSISETTRRDLLAATGIESSVVYQPIMPVSRLRSRKYLYDVMAVGRVHDANKRTLSAIHACQLLGFTAEQLVTVGNESPYYGGTYWGVATIDALNDLYNSVDFVIATGKNEGMGLPALEAMAAGAIPIICRDLTTREEFFPSSIFPEYLNVEADPQSIARFMARFLQDNAAMNEMKERLHAHYVANWQDRLSGVGVARAILDVYSKL